MKGEQLIEVFDGAKPRLRLLLKLISAAEADRGPSK